MIAVMAAELFTLVPANRGNCCSGAHKRWRSPATKTRELEFHQLLISYLDNRYLAKAYQQFFWMDISLMSSCI